MTSAANQAVGLLDPTAQRDHLGMLFCAVWAMCASRKAADDLVHDHRRATRV